MSKRSVRVALLPEHLAGVRQVVAENPGKSLRKLAPLAAQRLGLVHVTYKSLHNFLALHGVIREVPQHVADRSARIKAKRLVLVASPMVASNASQGGNHGR
ncbi:hypothetical protein RQP53_00580 [Paucibacter sp. APW11]|uniref:Uncharacterized protein n=1 Tax=Roseateles aquae TaxID=3077235 RepID=A0ABU3P5B3_9BURK|nr:hypothetical protein [Paucibacter sp. APW11]MDT8997764.1 hypothetical protein [Paucibacter sp. APW11]